MSSPLLYRQLHEQLRQWIVPKDRRHLQGFAEIVAAILQAESGCLSHWLPYLTHRKCQARSHMERLSYFVHNQQIEAETFYAPLLLNQCSRTSCARKCQNGEDVSANVRCPLKTLL